MRLDARKSLSTLHTEWDRCTQCSLGDRRQMYNMPYIAGEGYKHGIMVVGEGPGEPEEISGRPHTGYEGLVRGILEHIKAMDVVYLTHITPCRSCKMVTKADGTPMLNTFGGVPVPRFQDQWPLDQQLQACSARLFEEIYIVDPVVIVALGANVASLLAGQRVPAQSVGEDFTVRVPGMGQVALLTAKKGTWKRSSKAGVQYPTQRNTVIYTGIHTYAPFLAIQSKDDRSDKSPIREMTRHFKLALQIYQRISTITGVLDVTPALQDDDEED